MFIDNCCCQWHHSDDRLICSPRGHAFQGNVVVTWPNEYEVYVIVRIIDNLAFKKSQELVNILYSSLNKFLELAIDLFPKQEKTGNAKCLSRGLAFQGVLRTTVRCYCQWNTSQMVSYHQNDSTAIKVQLNSNITFVFSVLTYLFWSCFQRASEMARAQGLPFVYISANSGARIGLAEEVKHHFKVAWNDPLAPEKVIGFLNLSHVILLLFIFSFFFVEYT